MPAHNSPQIRLQSKVMFWAGSKHVLHYPALAMASRTDPAGCAPPEGVALGVISNFLKSSLVSLWDIGVSSTLFSSMITIFFHTVQHNKEYTYFGIFRHSKTKYKLPKCEKSRRKTILYGFHFLIFNYFIRSFIRFMHFF